MRDQGARAGSVSRRHFLRNAAAGGAAVGLAAPLGAKSLLAAVDQPGPTDRYVVLIAMAGGVRSKETIHKPEHIPNIVKKILPNGVVFTNTATNGSGHFGSTYSIFTGASERSYSRSLDPSPNPTVFEYLRKHCGYPADRVWISTLGSQQDKLLACGGHEEYGPQYGANLISGSGLFNQEFKSVMDYFGKPSQNTEVEEKALASIRGPIAESSRRRLASQGLISNSPEKVAEIERYILDEVASGKQALTGPGAADAQALRLSFQIMRIFKPYIMGIRLAQADVGHGNFNAYVDVIRRNDGEIGALWDMVQADPQLKGKTTFIMVPEFGRDRDLNKQGGLDHGDGTDDLRKVTMIIAGAGVKKGKTLTGDIEVVDIVPTVCHLFGIEAPLSTGRVLYEALG